MKQLYRILFFCALFFLPILANGQLYTVKDYGRKEGLTNVSFHTVQESSEGYLWFGSDGSGVVRFDGNGFDYLSQIQGRKNKHVSSILLRDEEVVYSTLYSGVFKIKDGKLLHLDYINPIGRTLGVYDFEEHLVVIGDGAIRIFKDTVLINEEYLSNFSPLTKLFKTIEIDGNLLIYSSGGNFRIRDKKIQTLENWLSIDKNLSDSLIGAYSLNGKIIFFDKSLQKEVVLSHDKVTVRTAKQADLLDVNDFVNCWDYNNGAIVLVTENGKIFKLDSINQRFENVVYNHSEPFRRLSDVLIDENNDIWLTSLYSGIHRVSLEPFTLMSNNELYQNGEISFFKILNTGEDVISINNKTTYIGCNQTETGCKEIKNLSVNSLTYYNDIPVVATNNGVYQIKNDKFELFEPLGNVRGEIVTLISYDFGYFWYAIAGKGLFRKDIKTGEEIDYKNAPAYFYNVISHEDSTYLYFGTNGGLYQYNRKTERLTQDFFSTFNEEYGYYVGNSTKDKYGTLWFSFDNALIGITKKREISIISSQDYLPSLLIYTLNADKYGNLLVGSNLGITVIEVNEQGEALTSMTFDKNNGFNGYETHMRVSYEDHEEGIIYVGTLEGLAIIRPEYLSKRSIPNIPIITSFRDRSVENLLEKEGKIKIQSQSNNVYISFVSINRNNNQVLYSYRLKGYDEEWTEWTDNNSAYFDNLKRGNYVFEVRASLNGFEYSEPASLAFKVSTPFYKTNSTIFLVIGLFLIVNVVILRRSSTLNWSDFMKSRDWDGDIMISMRLLYVGIMIHAIVHIIAPRIDNSIESHNLSIAIYHTLAFLYVMMHRFITPQYHKLYLDFGFVMLVAYNLVYVFISEVHPFYFVNVLILSIAVPYIFKKTIGVLIYTLGISGISAAVILIYQDATYNQYLFVIGISLVGFIVVAINYLQNKTFTRLIFTSGVINNGNSPVIAFDENNIMIFVSENLEQTLGVKDSLVGKNGKYLERFYSDNKSLGSFSFNIEGTKLIDGESFTSPLVDKNGGIVYYKWIVKVFPNNLKVIIGKDVTEERNIESNYKQIIKNIDRIILRTDIDGNLLFINDYGLKWLEKSRNELVDISFFSMVDLKEQSRVRVFFDDILRGREYDEYIEVPLNINGNVKWVALNISVFRKSAIETTIGGFLIIGRELFNRQE